MIFPDVNTRGHPVSKYLTVQHVQATKLLLGIIKALNKGNGGTEYSGKHINISNKTRSRNLER